ncbi:hypothetical protein GYMLUDRAFT_736512 [Collybiopsis luxurians FD-317 M1]|uniref:Cytochrome P450 n=1 Tax=Collybiopsis luxurians FD-317 M1 TaxID=944289 RepID=A0A0D0CHV3_9AGAR|nr:hypothetical protein GYMLUDRAFT_736512 [Collybiopsis luxurians FD-317 M1]
MDRIFVLYSALFFATTLLYIFSKRRSNHPLPPGPPGLPLVGNVLNAPSSFEWVKYAEWAKEYDSELIFLRVFGTGMLALSSREDAEELLEKRSAIYSNRYTLYIIISKIPSLPMMLFYRPSIPMMDIIGNSEVVVPVMPYCEHWKECRKLFHREVEAKTALHRPREIAATRRLMKSLCDSEGKNVSSSIWTLWSSDVVLSLAYGIEVLPENDPFVKIANEAANSFAMAGQPGSFLVNTLPVLRHIPAWLPGAGFQRKAAQWRKSIYALAEVPFDTVRARLALGHDVQSSIASRMIPTLNNDNPETFEKASTTLCHALANIFAAGPDIAVAMETFLLAMVTYPSVAKDAQNAIDRAIQSTAFPTFEDITDQKIPYLDALVSEVLRWNPVAPLAMPHATTADDVYKGYFIPKGTIVMPNVWSMLRDEKVYGARTEEFNPGRFLIEIAEYEGEKRRVVINTDVPYPEVAFGFGRRKCAGRCMWCFFFFFSEGPCPCNAFTCSFTVMAREVLSFAIASVLWGFDIRKATNDKGEVLEPSGKYISGAVCRPEPFECVFKVRSSHVRQLLLESLDD